MSISRRKFIEGTAATFVWVAGAPSMRAALLVTDQGVSASNNDLTGERVAHTPATWYRPYRSKISSDAAAATWVQIDLRASRPIDSVKLLPTFNGFPVRFRIEASDDATFSTSHLIADRAAVDYPDPLEQVVAFKARGVNGRYVRLTATRLPRLWKDGVYGLALRKIEVIDRGTDIAERCPVTVDEKLGNPVDGEQITRSPRPMGEYWLLITPGMLLRRHRGSRYRICCARPLAA